MAKPSQRIQRITGGGSDGWDLFYRAKDLIRQGVEVIELTIGEHDVKTDPAILDAMREAARAGHTGYASIPGVPELRQAPWQPGLKLELRPMRRLVPRAQGQARQLLRRLRRNRGRWAQPRPADRRLQRPWRVRPRPR